MDARTCRSRSGGRRPGATNAWTPRRPSGVEAARARPFKPSSTACAQQFTLGYGLLNALRLIVVVPAGPESVPGLESAPAMPDTLGSMTNA